MESSRKDPILRDLDPREENILMIVNPCAGRMQGEKYGEEMEEGLRAAGARVVRRETTDTENGESYAADAEKDGYTRIVCIGGAGTLNAVINGLLRTKEKLPVTYLPAGTTNDFAQTLQIPKNLPDMLTALTAGQDIAIDAGCINDRFFSYVASFGAFTKCSYATPPGMKHLLGHFAYVLEGAKDLAALRAYPLQVKTDDRIFEGEYAFGAFSNTVSIGGFLKYDSDVVDMQDGKLEMLLIRKPKTLSEVHRLLHAVTSGDFDDPLFDFAASERFDIWSTEALDWSVDGEYTAAGGNVQICCVKNAVRITIPERKD